MGNTCALRARVLIVEDDDLVAAALGRLCRAHATVVQTATERSAREAIRRSPPLTAALIDVRLGRDARAGLRVLDQVVARHPTACRALITGARDHDILRHAFERHCLFLPKPFTDTSLEALRKLLPPPQSSQDRVGTRQLAQYVEQRLVAWRLHGKQARIIELAVSGHAHTEIAERLGIRLNTLRTHVGRLLRRTEHASVDELAAQLLRDFANQVPPDE